MSTPDGPPLWLVTVVEKHVYYIEVPAESQESAVELATDLVAARRLDEYETEPDEYEVYTNEIVRIYPE